MLQKNRIQKLFWIIHEFLLQLNPDTSLQMKRFRPEYQYGQDFLDIAYLELLSCAQVQAVVVVLVVAEPRSLAWLQPKHNKEIFKSRRIAYMESSWCWRGGSSASQEVV